MWQSLYCVWRLHGNAISLLGSRRWASRRQSAGGCRGEMDAACDMWLKTATTKTLITAINKKTERKRECHWP